MQIANVKIKTRHNNDNNHNIEDDPLFERKIRNATEGLSQDCLNWLERVANSNKNNVIVITNYIMSMKTETKLSDSYRKTIVILLSKFSIGTYNIYRIHLMRFFKWLYSPDIEPDKRPKPFVIGNIPQLRRKEKSIYKPTDLWIEEDESFF